MFEVGGKETTGIKQGVTNTRIRDCCYTIMGLERDVWDEIRFNVKLIEEGFDKFMVAKWIYFNW